MKKKAHVAVPVMTRHARAATTVTMSVATTPLSIRKKMIENKLQPSFLNGKFTNAKIARVPHLGRVYDSRGDHITVLPSRRVVAPLRVVRLKQLPHHHRPLRPSVHGDGVHRRPTPSKETEAEVYEYDS